MKELPTLQEAIVKKAKKKLNDDIKKFCEELDTLLDTTKQCPVCKGTGIITVTEIIEENENKDIRRNTKKL